ncbi:hypothetical protein BDN72DRAFT_894278 [Pluteus cervinus]|uniref:Uncharacterized protein n=1 Tax=Pluteus cervinus TaxID=181527 RepID=A0ACD3B4S1_9AGAR|nr:hypothetical protein BDN72DRAFT_894278 [Pluteus cervinus]
MATIIVDSSDSSISFSSGTWRAQAFSSDPASGYYNGTEMLSGTDGGSMTFAFNGTSVSVWTSTPSTPGDLSVKIDKSNEELTTSGVGALYSSPTLNDGQHLMAMTFTGQTGFDFITVAAGQETPLEGKNLIVDDSDSLLEYSGSWTPGSPRTSSSYLNTTRVSETQGDSVAFPFIGTYVAVYARIDSRRRGSITSAFSIDGSAPHQYSTNVDGSASIGSVNTLIFSADNLPAANHVLNINVTGITGSQSLDLDYLIYRAAFPSLAQQHLAPSQSPSVADEPATSSPPNKGSFIQSQTHTGIIAGGVIGGVLLSILALLLFLLWRRRRKAGGRKSKQFYQEATRILPESGFAEKLSFSTLQSVQTMQTTLTSKEPVNYNYHYRTRSSLNGSRPSTSQGTQRDLDFLSPTNTTPYGKNGRPSTAPEPRSNPQTLLPSQTSQSPSTRSVTLTIPRKPPPPVDFL